MERGEKQQWPWEENRRSAARRTREEERATDRGPKSSESLAAEQKRRERVLFFSAVEGPLSLSPTPLLRPPAFPRSSPRFSSPINDLSRMRSTAIENEGEKYIQRGEQRQ
jgi:hypothetical protein